MPVVKFPAAMDGITARRFGSTSTFDPLSLSPYIWLQAAAANFYTDAGTTLVSADGDLIYRWADISGNSRHWNQATSGNRPTYKTNIVNSKPAARFDGTNDYLGVTVSGLSGASTVWCVLKLVNDPSSTGSGGCWNTSSASGGNNHYPYTDGTIYDGNFSSARKTTANPTPSLSSTFRRYCVVSSSSQWTSYLDGSQLYTTATNTPQYTGSMMLGTSDASNYWMLGDIVEWFWMNSEATSQNLTDMDSYFATRYGL